MITLAAINGSDDSGQQIIDNNNDNIDNNNDNNDNTDVNIEPVLFISPVENYQEGMGFSGSELIQQVTLKDYRTHKGIDFLTTETAEVKACYDGTVESVEKTFYEGNIIVIKHNDELFTIYKSLSDDVLVEEGYNVSKGEVIGYTSTTMSNECLEGNHLHLEVEYQGNIVDPTVFFEEGNK